MNATPKISLDVTERLAQLLERLDHSAVPVGADQYRSVVMHLVHEFADLAPSVALGPLLDSYPAAAEVYENLQYAHAGLCRSGLDAAMAAELRAKEAIARAMATLPHRMPPMAKDDVKTAVVADGLRYKSKPSGSPFRASSSFSGATMSCFMCGKHRLRSQMRTRQVLGKSQSVCAPSCKALAEQLDGAAPLAEGG